MPRIINPRLAHACHITFKMATIASTCYTSNTTLTDGSNTTTTETDIDLLSDSEISDSSLGCFQC